MRTHTRVLTAAAAAALILSVAGCGGDKGTNAAGRGASRTIEVTMTDNAFKPTNFTVGKGETVAFKFKNDGTVKHEAILGDNDAQMKHHDEMTASTATMEHGNPNHAGKGAEGADAITVEPGKTGELVHTFNESGTILIGCHEPGHWEAGMKANVNVT